MQQSVDLFDYGYSNFGLTISTKETVVPYQPAPNAAYIQSHISTSRTHLAAMENFRPGSTSLRWPLNNAVGSPCDEDISELQLQELSLTTDKGAILCDVSTPSHRLFVPPSFRRKVSSSLNNLSHPGSRATDKLVSDRFVWSGMHKDLKAWTRACLGCQRNKFQWHNKALIGTFPTPDARFSHVQLNIVGPLPLSNGCTRIRTTAYHPAANGMVERFHRQLKASLRTTDDPENWTDHLPLVLLGIHSSLKSGLDCCAAELVFGATVRLPSQMLSPTPRVAVGDPTNLLHRLRQFLRTLSPVLPRPSVSESYLEKDLETCSHVCLRCDRVRRPLEPPYDGPFRVISRGTKTFRIQRGTSEEVVSVDRLKAAVPDTPPDEPCGPLPPVPPPRPSIPPSRILPLPPCPQPPNATTPSSTNNTANQRCLPSDWLADAETMKGTHALGLSTSKADTDNNLPGERARGDCLQSLGVRTS
ncbi:hypothetical protein SprV_0200765900 [Sparganum proliferum]